MESLNEKEGLSLFNHFHPQISTHRTGFATPARERPPGWHSRLGTPASAGTAARRAAGGSLRTRVDGRAAAPSRRMRSVPPPACGGLCRLKPAFQTVPATPGLSILARTFMPGGCADGPIMNMSPGGDRHPLRAAQRNRTPLPAGGLRRPSAHVEPDQQDVPVLHRIVLPLQPQFAPCFRAASHDPHSTSAS